MSQKKKILLVSDSHGQNHNLWGILKKEKPYDMVIHCGDYEDYESELVKRAGCEVHIVAGNNDYGNDFPAQKVMGDYSCCFAKWSVKNCEYF